MNRKPRDSVSAPKSSYPTELAAWRWLKLLWLVTIPTSISPLTLLGRRPFTPSHFRAFSANSEPGLRRDLDHRE